MNPPSLLESTQILAEFDCGVDSMNSWLQQRALKWQKTNGSRVFTLTDEQGKVIAYYSLATGQVQRHVAPKKMTRNTPDPLPVIVLGRLAVDKNWSGKGIAADLLLDAFDRVHEVSKSIGVVAVVVHALSEDVVPFYERFGFIRSAQTDEALTLFKPLKDIAKEIELAHVSA